MYFTVSCLLSVNESNARGWYPNFHSGRLCPEMQRKLNNCNELCDLLLRANAICFKQETGTLQVTTMCPVPIKGPSRLFRCTYNCTTAYEFSFQKKIRVCQDKY